MYPVLRARYNPFGRGVVTLATPPQLATQPGARTRAQHLQLWRSFRDERKNRVREEPAGPVRSFSGHTDDIRDFSWRSGRVGGERAWQRR